MNNEEKTLNKTPMNMKSSKNKIDNLIDGLTESIINKENSDDNYIRECRMLIDTLSHKENFHKENENNLIKNNKRENFIKRLFNFYGNLPDISMDKIGRNNNSYASVDWIKKSITPHLLKNELFFYFDEPVYQNGKVGVPAVIQDINGEKKSVTAYVDDIDYNHNSNKTKDGKGNLDSMQLAGKCLTYSKRYSLYILLGLGFDGDSSRNSNNKLINSSNKGEKINIIPKKENGEIDFYVYFKNNFNFIKTKSDKHKNFINDIWNKLKSKGQSITEDSIDDAKDLLRKFYEACGKYRN